MTCKNVSRDRFGKGASRPIIYPNRELVIDGVVSPRVGVHHNIPRPLHPGEDGFCEMMDEVIEVRASVIRGEMPVDFLEKHFPWPDQLSTSFDWSMFPEIITNADVSTPADAAALVRMDWPIDLGVFMYQYLRMKGVPLRDMNNLEFVENTVGFTAQMSHHLWGAMELAFQSKWFWGSVRPEEYFGIDGCVFTAYTEGCPAHPAYPAGHATAGGALLQFLLHFFDLTDFPEIRDQLFAAAYAFAQYRTFAGVHTVQDNIAGLKFGFAQCVKPITLNT